MRNREKDITKENEDYRKKYSNSYNMNTDQYNNKYEKGVLDFCDKMVDKIYALYYKITKKIPPEKYRR